MFSASSFRKSYLTRSLATLGMAAAMILPSGTIANGAEEGWSWSKLNPFGSQSSSSTKSKNSRAPRNVSDRKPVGKSKSATSSTLNSVTQGTSNFMGKTKEVLMPWSKPAPKSTKMSVSRTTPTKKSRAQPQEKSWYEFWKSQPDEETGPKTVNEFLALPRPE